MRNLHTLIILAGTSTAVAEPSIEVSKTARPAGYVSFGGIAGFDQLLIAGLQLDGGLRLGTSAFYARGAIEAGLGGDIFEDGDYVAARLGIEVRRCGRVCLFAGVDVGGRHTEVVRREPKDPDGMTETDSYDHKLLIPRVGIETGSRVRGRFAVEVPTVFDGNELHTSQATGIALAASIGYAF